MYLSLESEENKENIPPVCDDNDELYDFDAHSYKYDYEHSTDQEYKYSSSDNDTDNDDTSYVFIDQCPGRTLVLEALASSSEDEDTNSCRNQGYEYNYDAIDMYHEEDNDLSPSSDNDENQVDKEDDFSDDNQTNT